MVAFPIGRKNKKGCERKMIKRKLGKIIRDLPSGVEEENPRNSEGAFLTLDDGKIMFAYSRFRGDSAEDHAVSDIAILCSSDGGESFCESSVALLCGEEQAINIMSVSLMQMKYGEIGLFYLVRENRSKLQMYLRKSDNHGKTWKKRILCTPEDGFFVVNNDRVIRLSNGRILIPAAMHQTEGESFGEWAKMVFFYSDDDGLTWKKSPGECKLPRWNHCASGLQEPGVVEMKPGVLWAFARTDLGRQYEAFSGDYGETWSECGPSVFFSPKSPMSIKKAPNGVIYAIWNPVPEYNGREKGEGIFLGGRTPLVMAVSRDNGKNFSEPVAFEWEENHGYCYCAIHFVRDGILLAYCAGGTEDKSCLARCRIRKIQMEEVARNFW